METMQMSRGLLRRAAWAAAVVLAGGLLWAAPLRADVKVERVYSGPLPGVVGSIDLSDTVYYQGGERMRREPSTEVRTSKIKLWGSAKKAEITRLDRGVYWYVDYAEEAYTEQTLEQLKAQAHQGMADLERGGTEDGSAKADEKPTKRIVRNELNVERTGKKQEINGFPTEEYRVTWLLETEDTETGEHVTTVYTADNWNTPEDNERVKALRAEEDRFQQNLQRKLGLELSPERATQLGMAAVASAVDGTDDDAQAQMGAIAKKLAQIKGYAIRITITAESDSPEARENAGDSGEEKSAGGLMDKAKSTLFGFIGEKKKEPKADASGRVEVFRSKFEVRSIENGALEDRLFAPPQGFKRVKEL